MRKVAIAVGHNGPKTGTYWQDPEGLLDEFELAAQFAVAAMKRLQDLGWLVFPVTGTYKKPHYLYEKAILVERIRPDLFIEIHLDSRPAGGNRGSRWPGAQASVFDWDLLPNETDFAAGVNVVYFEKNTEARSLGLKLVHHIVQCSGFGMANDDGLDPRPEMSTEKRKRVYLPLICDPGYRAKKHDDRFKKWHGCPCVLLECGAVTSPADREQLRENQHIFDQVGHGIGMACDEWYSTHREDEDV